MDNNIEKLERRYQALFRNFQSGEMDEAAFVSEVDSLQFRNGGLRIFETKAFYVILRPSLFGNNLHMFPRNNKNILGLPTSPCRYTHVGAGCGQNPFGSITELI